MTEIKKTALGHINIRGDADAPEFVKAVQDVVGQALPVDANTISLARRRVYWLGPDEWLIVCAIDESVDLAARLEQALAVVRNRRARATGQGLPAGSAPFSIRRRCLCPVRPRESECSAGLYRCSTRL